jgi:hypothetical protein
VADFYSERLSKGETPFETTPKPWFTTVLDKMYQRMQGNINKIIRQAFFATGLWPMDVEQVLKREYLSNTLLSSAV